MSKCALIEFLETCGIGLERGTVRIAPHNPRWLTAFDQVFEYIEPAVSGATCHPIGSTSIPGCEAKPILDIAIEYDPHSGFSRQNDALIGLGFTSKGERGVPGRLFYTFYNEAETIDYVHLHAFELHSQAVADYLTLRDHLKVHRTDRDAYTQLKRDLIARGVPRTNYPDAKSSFILKLLG